MAFCVNCGTKIEEGIKFCSGCGFQVGSAGVSINQEKAVNIIQTQPNVLPMLNIPQNQNARMVQPLGADEKYCFSCGSLIKKAAELCTKCGVYQSMRNNTSAIDVYCASCGAHIKKEAAICPFCGVQQIKMLCPKCGTDQLAIGKKGFGTGAAVVSTVLLGPVGLAAGLIGSKKEQAPCQKCGHKWEPGKSK
jgi:RNA polymerase subunit RPABC4/transcription elongation factor Spt4